MLYSLLPKSQAFYFIIGIGVVLCFFFIVPQADAATYNVDSTENANDGDCSDGDCTVREAFTEAAASAGADIINIPDGNYLVSATFTIPDGEPVTVNGESEAGTVVTLAGADGFVLPTSSDTDISFNDITFSMTADPEDTGWVPILIEDGHTGDIALANVTIEGNTLADISYDHTDSAESDFTGNLTITNSTLSSGAYANIGIGARPAGGFPTVASSLTGNVVISGSTLTLDSSDSATIMANIMMWKAALDGSFSVTNSTFNNAQGSDTQYSSGIWMYDDDAEVSWLGGEITGDVDITDSDFLLTGIASSGVEIDIKIGGDLEMSRNTVDIDDTTIALDAINIALGQWDSVCVGGCGIPTSAVYEDNTITRSGGSLGLGILAQGASITISNNDIQFSSTVRSYPIYLEMLPDTSSSVISGNTTIGGTRASIALEADGDTDLTHTTSIFNNILIGGEGEDNQGIFMGDFADSGSLDLTANIYNNTVVGFTTGGDTTISGGITALVNDDLGGTDTLELNVFNNIVQGNANGLNFPSGQTVNADYNLVYGNTADGGSNYVSVSVGEHDVNDDALFTDPGNGDYSLQNTSPAINAGIGIFETAAVSLSDVTAPTQDIDGNTRASYGMIDIGASEFTGDLPQDENNQSEDDEDVAEEAGSSEDSDGSEETLPDAGAPLMPLILVSLAGAFVMRKVRV